MRVCCQDSDILANRAFHNQSSHYGPCKLSRYGWLRKSVTVFPAYIQKKLNASFVSWNASTFTAAQGTVKNIKEKKFRYSLKNQWLWPFCAQAIRSSVFLFRWRNWRHSGITFRLTRQLWGELIFSEVKLNFLSVVGVQKGHCWFFISRFVKIIENH